MSTKQSEEKNKTVELVNKSKFWIRTLAIAVGLGYGWLKFKGFDFHPVINQVSTELLIKLSLSIYYFSWWFGATLDGSDQGIVFQKVINNGKVPKLGIFTAITVAISFFILCAYWESQILPTILMIFWIINFIQWKVFTKYVMRPYYNQNQEFYSKLKNQLIRKRFDIVYSFLYSNWQYYRFLVGFIFLIPTVILTISNKYNDFFVKNLKEKQFIIALLILLFVLIVEGWIWYYRLKRKFTIKILTEVIEEKMKK